MRVRLYNKEHPGGKVFTDKDDYERALREEIWFENFWMPSGKVPDDLKEFWGDRPIEPLRLPEIKNEPTKEIVEAANQNKAEEALDALPEPKIKYCECGCGTPVKERFVQGHYAIWKKKQKYPGVYGVKNGDSKNDKPPD